MTPPCIPVTIPQPPTDAFRPILMHSRVSLPSHPLQPPICVTGSPTGTSQLAVTLESLFSHSACTSLQFPVGHIHHMLKKGNYAHYISASAPGELLPSPVSAILTLPLVYGFLAIVLKYLAAKTLKLASNTVHNNKKQRIMPCHLQCLPFTTMRNSTSSSATSSLPGWWNPPHPA